MANQSMISFEIQEDDLYNWEFVNQFDFGIVGDDEESMYEVIDFVESIDDHEDVKEDPIVDIDADSADVVKKSSVSDLTQNQEFIDEDLSRTVDIYHKNHELCENFDRTSSFGGNQFAYDVVKKARVSDLAQNHEFIGADLSRNVDDLLNNGGSYNNLDRSSSYDDYDDEIDDRYGLDDELVPWEVNHLLVRHRTRKSGKNSLGNLAKSKKSSVIFTKPGCVRGKHCLGIKVY